MEKKGQKSSSRCEKSWCSNCIKFHYDMTWDTTGVATNIQHIRQKYDHIQRKKLKKKVINKETYQVSIRIYSLSGGNDGEKCCYEWEKIHTYLNDWSCYFHDLRIFIFQIKHQIWRGIMLKEGIGYKGKTNIQLIDTKLKNDQYMKLIDEEIVNAERIFGDEFTFQ